MSTKKLFQKNIFKNVLGPLLRSTIKTVCPPLATGVEIVKNVIKKEGDPNPHNWTSIAMQIIAWAAILYAFGTGVIPLEKVLAYLGFVQP